MRENRVKRAWQEDGAVLNGWLMAERGFRFVTVLSDGRLLASAAAQTVTAMKGEGGVIRSVC